MGLDILNSYDRIRDQWETQKGFYAGCILLVVIYFTIASFFSLWDKGVPDVWINILVPFVLVVALFFFWITDSNRFFIRTKDNITTGITVMVDNDRDRLIINKIVKKVIDKINFNDEYSNIKLRLLPTNFCVHDKHLSRYHQNFSFLYDLIIRISVESGHYESIEKIIITKLSVSFRAKSTFGQKRVFFNTVDLIRDMDLQVGSRNWEYLMQNDGIDKVKYLENIYHIIMYYIGFYAIYSDRYSDAMRVMTPLYDARKTKLKLSKKEGNKQTFQLLPYNVAEGRLATILIDLYFYVAVKNYEKQNTKEAMANFLRLEALIKDHPKKFDQYISMARYYYELGNLPKSIEYTEKARKLRPNSIEIFLNLGFYAILDDSVEKFCDNYNKLFSYRGNFGFVNWLDVLDFQLKQKNALPHRQAYFNFSTGFIEYVFIGYIKAHKFKAIVNQYHSSERYNCFYKLGMRVLHKELQKSKLDNPNRSRGRKKSKRKKKRR